MKKLVISKSYTDRESIALYLKDIRKYPILSAEEEKEVTKKAKNGDVSAIDKLCKSNLRFVISVAKQYQGQGLELPDLISEGNYGLVKAVEKFDPDKGFKFISYAVWWIRQSIISALQNNSRSIRLPVGQIVNLTNINRFIKSFEQKEGRVPNTQEIAEQLNLNEDRVTQLLEYNNKMTSIDTPFTDSEEAGTLVDIIPNKNTEKTDSLLNRNNLHQLIQDSLDRLSARDHDIISLSFGIDTAVLDNRQIGELFGVTGERIRQIKDKIITRLKNSKGLKNLYYGTS